MKGAAALGLLLGLVLLPGCDWILGPGDDEAAIQTDRDRYVAYFEGYRQYGFTLIATFSNPTGGTLYLERCNGDTPYPIYGIGRDDDQEAAWDPNWGCLGGVPRFAVPPGGTRVDTLHIRGPNAFSRSGEAHGVLTGSFRLWYGVRSCRADGPCPNPVPEHVRRSNRFTVAISPMDS